MTEDLQTLFLLLFLFQLKHYLADFPLQREYMLRKSLAGWDWVVPLSVHCLVHASVTLAITLWFSPALWYLAIIDFFAHFAMDRIKSGPRYLGRYNDITAPAFWNCFGFDQMYHHLTHYCFVFFIYSSLYQHTVS